MSTPNFVSESDLRQYIALSADQADALTLEEAWSDFADSYGWDQGDNPYRGNERRDARRRPRERTANAMSVAAYHLNEAARLIEAEASWIGRNALGENVDYLLASIESRRREIDNAYAAATHSLNAARREIESA